MEIPATSLEVRGFSGWPEFASEGVGVLGGGEGEEELGEGGGKEELGGSGGKEELEGGGGGTEELGGGGGGTEELEGGGGVDVVGGGGDTVEAIDEDGGAGGDIWPCRYDVCPGTLKRKTRKLVSEKFSSEGLAKYF
jgi:hypothetical protein